MNKTKQAEPTKDNKEKSSTKKHPPRAHIENKQIENWRSYGYTHDGNDSGVRCRD